MNLHSRKLKEKLQKTQDDNSKTLVVITSQFLCTDSKDRTSILMRVYAQSTPCTRRNIPYHIELVILKKAGKTKILGIDNSLHSDFERFKGDYEKSLYLEIGEDIKFKMLEQVANDVAHKEVLK